MTKKPNIVLFVAEDLDYEGTSCYPATSTGYTGLAASRNPLAAGYELHDKTYTPTIDGISKRGFKGNQYYCPSAICTPARYCLMTGRYPERSLEFLETYPPETQANIFFNTPISSGESSLPKTLQTVGYKTGMTGKWHNIPQHMKLRLTDIFESIPMDADPRSPEVRKTIKTWYTMMTNYLSNGFGWDSVDRLYFDNPEPFHPKKLGCHNLEWIIEGALEFLDQNSGKEDPFFLYIPVTVPHARYRGDIFETSDPFATPSGILDKLPDSGMMDRESIINRVKQLGLPDYAREGLWLDEAVRAVVEKLEATGSGTNTCFIFTSDHPTAAKQTCHLGRVPFLVDWPGHTKPMESEALISHLDLVSTICEIAGVTDPGDVGQDGYSFKTLLEGKSEESPRDSLLLEVVNSRALVRGSWKYIANALPRELPAIGDSSETGWLGIRAYDNRHRPLSVSYDADKLFPYYLEKEQLYHTGQDPLEQTNLAADPKYAEAVNELREELIAELAKLPHIFALPPTC